MNPDTVTLIETARSVCGAFPLRDDFSAGGVGAALKTVVGTVYTGICIDLGSGLGFCAEVAAIAQMLTNRETRIAEIVAVCGERILPPCGRCRETMAQIDPANLDTRVVVEEDRIVTLRELLPHWWMD
jgi:cytidine deaminase